MAIKIARKGFYQGFSRPVTVVSKILIGTLILWAVVFPEKAGSTLAALQSQSTSFFGAWYIWITAYFVILCLGLAIYPKSGRTLLGQAGDKPEFSNFSWLSMMFGAGIGVGMLTFSTAEPLFHFVNSPDVILGNSESADAGNVRNAYKWAFLHYGLTPWAIYGIVGLSLAFFTYNRGRPLTIRSGLRPLFGKSLDGGFGHAVDIAAIIATIIGIGVTLGYGVAQLATGVFKITGVEWLSQNGEPSLAGLLFCLALIILVSILSALSGIGRGIKWLSNVNMGLSVFLLLFFMLFGASLFAFKTFFLTIWDYLLAFPAMAFTVYGGGDETREALKSWQGGNTIFYWAWWIAFAPFVGLFLARVSRGRTIREFIVGAMIVPCLVCLTWLVLVGGTAISLELDGTAGGKIMNAHSSAQLYETIEFMLSPGGIKAMSIVIVVLLLTYLVTSADSAILIINTIASGGDESGKHPKHIILWGLILGAVVGVLLRTGGIDALKSAMIIGAVPFSIVMALMGFALAKAIFFPGSAAAAIVADTPEP